MASRSASKDKKTPTGLPLGPQSRVVLLKGKEAFLRAQHTSGLRDKLAAEHGDVEMFLFDGERDDAADILDECRSFGLMGGHKLVVVDNADAFVRESNRSLVERYAQAPCDQATLVLRAETWRPGKLDKMIEKIGSVVPCEEPEPDKAMAWCRVIAKKRHNADLSERAAWMLIDRFGPDLGRLQAEVGKLAVASGATDETPASIEPELIAEMTGGGRELEPWSAQQPVLTGDPSFAIRGIRQILDSAPRDAHVPVGMALAQLADNLHALAAGSARGGQSLQTIGRARKLFGDRLNPLADKARRADPDKLYAAFRDALDTDMRAKSGASRPEINLEALAIQITQAMR